MTMRYTKDHEYIRVEGDTGIVGITDYAQSQLGDVVYVELPEGWMAHEYRATVCWTREDGAAFTDGRYSRGHVWRFDGGLEVPASSAPASVPPPFSRPDAVDPEEAFVAALSSCHMLFFLFFAAKAGFRIDRYTDEAIGEMGKNSKGATAML